MTRETKLMIALTIVVIASTANCMINSFAIGKLRNDILNASIVCEHIEEN